MILGIADKLKDHMGKIKYSLLCFEKLTLMLFKTPEHVLVMSLEAGTFARPIYERLNSLLDFKQQVHACRTAVGCHIIAFLRVCQ
jgi:hypothetical protein